MVPKYLPSFQDYYIRSIFYLFLKKRILDTLAPPETGRRNVLALRASVALDKEEECSVCSAAQ